MSKLSLEERVTVLEAKVTAIEERLCLSPPQKGILALFDRPPPTPEEPAILDEVQGFSRMPYQTANYKNANSRPGLRPGP